MLCLQPTFSRLKEKSVDTIVVEISPNFIYLLLMLYIVRGHHLQVHHYFNCLFLITQQHFLLPRYKPISQFIHWQIINLWIVYIKQWRREVVKNSSKFINFKIQIYNMTILRPKYNLIVNLYLNWAKKSNLK